VIVYHTEFEGTHHELGTSGFLYRSSKLMYDKATNSLWSTLQGRPVIGPLVGQGIQLESNTVVTTNWGTWRKTHPDTTVISLTEIQKLHTRNYDEGQAYQKYFADDVLMFPVPQTDTRLKNKAPVFALRFQGAKIGEVEPPIAFESAFLVANPVYRHQYAGIQLTIVTDSSGAHRAYDVGETKFEALKNDTTVVDEAGQEWTITTDAIVGSGGIKLPRLPSHNVFWFGWHAQHPETELIRME
jgi:hypothetical protein